MGESLCVSKKGPGEDQIACYLTDYLLQIRFYHSTG